MKPAEHEIMRAVEDRYWWYQALRQHVANIVESSGPNFSLLDAGCGSGGMLAALRERFPQAELSGIDAFERGIELTAERGLGTRLLTASVHELPFPGDSFDFVLSLDVWSHAGVDDALAAHETQRVLRPGGRLILNLAAFEFLKGAHDHATDVTRRYRRPEVRALLEGAGFTLETPTHLELTLTPPLALARRLSLPQIGPEAVRSDLRPLP